MAVSVGEKHSSIVHLGRTSWLRRPKIPGKRTDH